MSPFGQKLVRALTRNIAETSPDAEDPRLRGRTYAVPFEMVWQASLELARGGLRGWKLRSADDMSGIINARSAPRLFGAVADVKIRVRLDEDAQTRIDARSVTRKRRADLGSNTRRLDRFFSALDRRLANPRRATGASPRPAKAEHPAVER